MEILYFIASVRNLNAFTFLFNSSHKIKPPITEAFGAGTAALVTPISTINIQGTDFHLPAYNAGNIMFQIKNKLDNIRYGIEEDIYNWNHII